MIIRNLIIKNQHIPKDMGYDMHNFHANLESIACNNEETYVLVDHCLETYTFFNYNKSLFHLFGNNFNSISKELYYKISDTDINYRIKKYIDVANSYFTDKNLDDKCFYFSILYEYGNYGSKTGLRLKLVPILYTFDQKLYATLCIIDKVPHVGKTELQFYQVRDKKKYIYDDILKRFIDEEECELSEEECQILTLSGEGKKEREIAEILNTTLSKIKQSKSALYDKLKVKTISEAIFVAYKKGILR